MFFDPAKGFSTAPHPYSLHVAGTDLIPSAGTAGLKRGAPLESISITETGPGGQSTMSFLYEDPLKSYALPARGEVDFLDHTIAKAGYLLFTGNIARRSTVPWWGQISYAMQVDCVDHNIRLDTTVLPALKYKAGFDDKALIQGVLGHASRHPMVTAHSSFVTSTNSNMPAFDFSHITLRAAIEAIAAGAGADRHYYVDFAGRIHYYQGAIETAMGNAPFSFSDTPTGTQLATSDLTLDYDDSTILNAVYVAGATPAGSGWVKDEASIKTYGLIAATMEAPQSRDAKHCESAGRHFLATHANPLVRGSFSYQGSESGFRVGQQVTVTNAALGISGAAYPIRQIDTTFQAGGTIRTYQFSIGELPASKRRAPNLQGTGGTVRFSPPGAPKTQTLAVGALGLPRDPLRN